MQTTTDGSYTPPAIGRGPAAEGRRAALRSFHDDMMTMEGDVFADIDKVQNGTAPQEFKDAYMSTLFALAAALTTTGN